MDKIDRVNVALLIIALFLFVGYLEIATWFPEGNINNNSVYIYSRMYEKEVSQFYNYNLSNKYYFLDIFELMDLGGVCWHYADYYVDRAKEDGFVAGRINFPVNNNSSHSIAVISNDEGYCILSNDRLIGCEWFG